MSNAELRFKNEEVGEMYEVPSRKYEVRSTRLKLMSNAELRFKNEEVGEMYHVQSTNYQVGIRISYETRIATNLSWLLCLVSCFLKILVHCTYLFSSEENSVRTCNQNTSKRDPAALFVFDCPQETGTEGKTHGSLWCLHQFERSSNRRNSPK